MSNTQAIYNYDKLGRLVNVLFSNGASATYQYDEAGNRSTLVEVPATAPPPPPTPTVIGLPKKIFGDFKNGAMAVLTSSGELMGWGDDTTGMLANGIQATTSINLSQNALFDPNTTVPPKTATIVDWAITNACMYVVYSNGWVYSAGSNDYGQLGHGDTTDRPFLKRIEYFVTNSVTVTKVWPVGGYNGTNGAGCVYFQGNTATATNIMYGCGLNTAGNLGSQSAPTTNATTPVLCNGIGNTSNHVVNVVAVMTGAFVSCYMVFNDGTLMVAGYNLQGQLGINSIVNQTGIFVSAQITGGANVSNLTYFSANAGGTAEGNAIFVDSSGHVWTTGYNAHGECAQGNVTTPVKIFTQVSNLSNIKQAELGGGEYGYGYALDTSNNLWVWGYNGQSQLFFNDTTQRTTAVQVPAANLPSGVIQKVWFPRGGQAITTMGQLIILTSTGILAWSGANVGQVPVASGQPVTYNLLAMPLDLMNGNDSIADLFVHGSGLLQRWFVMTANGNLFGCGDNTNCICTGSVSAANADIANNAQWQPVILY